jgi:AcrR family transcriptional regulator
MPRIVKDPVARGDRRHSRWDDHREARRAELVDAAVAAIDEHGPSAGIAEIAASAGVSKPVLYRYFADKDDLYRAVGAWGANAVIEGLLPVLIGDAPIRERVQQGCDAYLELISRHPHVFFLLVEHPTNEDPLADGKEMVAAAISRTLGDGLRELGVDAAGAEPWAHGLVGLGLSTGEWWLRRHTMSRAAVSDHLSSFIWHAFEGIAREHGVRVDSQGRLRLVSGQGN